MVGRFKVDVELIKKQENMIVIFRRENSAEK